MSLDPEFVDFAKDSMTQVAVAFEIEMPGTDTAIEFAFTEIPISRRGAMFTGKALQTAAEAAAYAGWGESRAREWLNAQADMMVREGYVRAKHRRLLTEASARRAQP